MAYATSTPPASSLDADAPIIVCGNALDYADRSADPKWVNSSDMAASSVTADGFYGRRLFDGDWRVYTRPNADATEFRLVARVDPSQPIDYVAILGHNFYEGDQLEWVLYTADNDTFTTNNVAMASEASIDSSKRRIVACDDRYTNVERIQLLINTNSAFRPRIGEIILGARYQFETAPRDGFDYTSTRTRRTRVFAVNGAKTDAVYARGQSVVSPSFHIGSATERNAVRAAIDAVNDYGSRDVLWIPRPTSEPGKGLVITLPDDLTMPIVRSPNLHEFTFQGEEVGPFYATE